MLKHYLTAISVFILFLNVFAADGTEGMARKAANARLQAQQHIWSKDPMRLAKETCSAGRLNGNSGIYFCRLEVTALQGDCKTYRSTIKMTFAK